MKKQIKWNYFVYTPQIKRSCDCRCCLGCGTNNLCRKFGPNFCTTCKEWRCNKCYIKKYVEIV